MSVSRRYPNESGPITSARSMQDLGVLLAQAPDIIHQSERKVPSKMNAQTMTPGNEANPDTLAQAIAEFRQARQQMLEDAAKATAHAQRAGEDASALRQQMAEHKATSSEELKKIQEQVEELKAAAAKPAAADPARPMYLRALDVAQQVGGLAAFAGGLYLGGKVIYDQVQERTSNSDLPA